MGYAAQFFTQWLRQVGHRVEVRCAALVDPAKQLGGAKSSFSQTVAKTGQSLKVVVEQVGQHGLSHR